MRREDYTLPHINVAYKSHTFVYKITTQSMQQKVTHFITH